MNLLLKVRCHILQSSFLTNQEQPSQTQVYPNLSSWQKQDDPSSQLRPNLLQRPFALSLKNLSLQISVAFTVQIRDTDPLLLPLATVIILFSSMQIREPVWPSENTIRSIFPLQVLFLLVLVLFTHLPCHIHLFFKHIIFCWVLTLSIHTLMPVCQCCRGLNYNPSYMCVCIPWDQRSSLNKKFKSQV